MSKKKNPMALYDVLSKGKSPTGSMHVPDWAKKPAAQPGAPRLEGDQQEPPPLDETPVDVDIVDPDEPAEEPAVLEEEAPLLEDEPPALQEDDDETPELPDAPDEPEPDAWISR